MDSRNLQRDARLQVIDIALSHIYNIWPDTPRYDVEYIGKFEDTIPTQFIEWQSPDRARRVVISAEQGNKHIHRADTVTSPWFRIDSSFYQIINGWWNVAICKKCGTIAITGPFHDKPTLATSTIPSLRSRP